jgi:hypothetical protein
MLIALPDRRTFGGEAGPASDYWARFFAILGLSLPDFWLATVGHHGPRDLGASGSRPVGFAPLWEDPVRAVSASSPFRRSSSGRGWLAVSDADDALLAARGAATGLHPHGARPRARASARSIVRHALKNAFIPVVTVIGQQFSVLLGGTVDCGVHLLQPGVGSLMLSTPCCSP